MMMRVLRCGDCSLFVGANLGRPCSSGSRRYHCHCKRKITPANYSLAHVLAH